MERRGARDFYPQISQISTDGEKGCPLLSERSGNRYFAQKICANLCNLRVPDPSETALNLS